MQLLEPAHETPDKYSPRLAAPAMPKYSSVVSTMVVSPTAVHCETQTHEIDWTCVS